MTRKKWISLTIGCPDATRELLIPFLWELGATGFVESDKDLIAYIPTPAWEQSGPNLFDEYSDRLKKEGHQIRYTKIETIADKNWNEEWEKSIEPIEASQRIVITPSWRTPELKTGQVAIVIDPKMSFGTGYHETTRLMLRMLDKSICPGMKVLDVGTGTGVLAIAAIKMGAAQAIGVDNDEWSFENANENIAKNSVAGKVAIRLGSLANVDEREFDLVLVNIHYRVIVEMIDELMDFLKLKSRILISGILEGDEADMRSLLQKNRIKVDEILQEGEWIGIIGTRVAD